MPLKAFALCIAVVTLSACSTHTVGLSYQSSREVVPPNASFPLLSVGSFVDQRGETATWFGSIRGGYGNPLKKLEATPSISALVQTAFTDGLRARGFQSSNATYQISGVIKKLDCSQFVRRDAHAEIEVSIFDLSTGNRVFNQTYTADELDGSLLTLSAGIFGSVESLRALAEKALSEVVDKALDDTALRRSIHLSGA